jgi:uncharacterized protein YutE (UPF0331/DUF86 family)
VSAITNIFPKDIDYEKYAQILVFVAQGIFTILIATRYTKSKQQDKYDITLRELRTQVQAEKTPIDATSTTPYELVMLYHQFISLSKALLKLRGYGIAGENIRLLGNLLVAQNILDKKDLRQVNKIRTVRNKIVHPDMPVDKKELAETRKILETLVRKVKEAIITLEEK